jgi:hypothetical protein
MANWQKEKETQEKEIAELRQEAEDLKRRRNKPAPTVEQGGGGSIPAVPGRLPRTRYGSGGMPRVPLFGSGATPTVPLFGSGATPTVPLFGTGSPPTVPLFGTGAPPTGLPFTTDTGGMFGSMAEPTAEEQTYQGGPFGAHASPTAAAALPWTPQPQQLMMSQQYAQPMQQPYGMHQQQMQQQYMQQQYMQQQYPGQHHGGQPTMTVRDHEIDQMILREEMQQESAKKIKAIEKEGAEELLNQQRLNQMKALRSQPK